MPRQRLNYLLETGPGILRERDAATCGHCQRQMILTPSPGEGVVLRVEPKCSGCGKFVCEECKRIAGCDTWERKMERQEARAKLLRAMEG